MRVNPTEFLQYWLLRLAKAMDRRPAATGTGSPAARRILLVSSTALGDTVLSTAAIGAVRRHYPAARLVGLFHTDHIELFRRLPELDAVVAYHGGYRRFLRTALALRREAPDMALILHGNEPQATPLAYLSGARRLYKLPNTSRFRFLLTNAEPVIGWSQLGHGMDQRLRVAALAGARTVGARTHLPVDARDRASIAEFLGAYSVAAGQAMVGLQPGASSRARMWPAERFVELGRRLLERHGDLRLVLTGSPSEAHYCRDIADRIGPQAIVAAGALPLDLLPALVQRLGLLVSGDTGTMHVAVAVGTPVVALFAASDPRTSGPATDPERHTVIYRPCPDLAIRSKSDDQSCIARISVGEVLTAVEHRLGAQGTGDA